MPHISISFSSNVADVVEIEGLVACVHEAHPPW